VFEPSIRRTGGHHDPGSEALELAIDEPAAVSVGADAADEQTDLDIGGRRRDLLGRVGGRQVNRTVRTA
jgi:hypothetical protein